MPCRYDPTPEEIRQGREAARARLVAPYQAEIAKLNVNLCKACKALEENGIEIPRGLKGWWKQHQKTEGHVR